MEYEQRNNEWMNKCNEQILFRNNTKPNGWSKWTNQRKWNGIRMNGIWTNWLTNGMNGIGMIQRMVIGMEWNGMSRMDEPEKEWTDWMERNAEWTQQLNRNEEWNGRFQDQTGSNPNAKLKEPTNPWNAEWNGTNGNEWMDIWINELETNGTERNGMESNRMNIPRNRNWMIDVELKGITEWNGMEWNDQNYKWNWGEWNELIGMEWNGMELSPSNGNVNGMEEWINAE